MCYGSVIHVDPHTNIPARAPKGPIILIMQNVRSLLGRGLQIRGLAVPIAIHIGVVIGGGDWHLYWRTWDGH